MENTNTAQVTPITPSKLQGKGNVNSCRYGGGHFEISERGVHFQGKDKDGNEQSPKWICTILRIVAKTRDERGCEWGRLLEWHDDDGKLHQWAMPIEWLEGDGSDVRRELARRGLQTSSGLNERNLLSAYIKTWPVDARGRCVERLGWHGNVFVTPSGTIGESDELMVFQNSHAIEPACAESGSVSEWIASVASLAQGNSRLAFVISTAFAAPLADIAGEDSGGFHLRGASSSGKSTALNVAASVWGNPSKYIRLWRGTLNGFEGLAALHNDGLLILDEISQIDPAVAGETAYLLANGQGKARAQRNGMARATQRWKVIYLSAGEESLSAIMSRAGKKSTAGQEIRLADIEADAGMGMGMFEELHGQPNPATLATTIKDASTKYHGTVGTAWLNHLTSNRPQLAAYVTERIKSFVASVVPVSAAGQVVRVARRFALVAVAGELATQYGLTGWPEGEAIDGARKCFAAWLEAFGGSGNREERAIIAQVHAFFETHGASRFEDILATGEQRVPNRVGYHRSGANNVREFLVLPEAFRLELCQGFNEKTVKQVLLDAGLLLPAKDGQPSQNMRLPGLGSSRVYVIRYIGSSPEPH